MKEFFQFAKLSSALLLFVVISSFLLHDAENDHLRDKFFNLEQIALQNTNCYLTSRSSQFDKTVLKIKPEEGNDRLVIWEKGDDLDWSHSNYLIFELYGNNEYSGMVRIEFYKEEENCNCEEDDDEKDLKVERRIYTHIGIMPKLKTKLTFPLRYLDGQNVFLPRFPRQLKGTVWGNRMIPEDIVKVTLKFGPVDGALPPPEFELASISLTDRLPEPYSEIDEPIIDEFGQWKLKDWEGKVHSEEELIAQNHKFEHIAESATYPDDWSKYGGWKGKRFEKTGFFRTHHDGERWWLVDPEGYAFLSTGVNVMHLGSSGPVTDNEDLFENLPEGTTTIDFYQQNLTKVYGNQTRRKWGKIAKGLMKEYRFNTVGNWSDRHFIRNNNLPYVLPLHGFPETEVRLFRDFPDVFSAEYAENADHFAEQLKAYADDRYMIGYFLQNEPEWATGYNNLAYEMFSTDQLSETKRRFVAWIAEEYAGDPTAFNLAWEVNIESFDDLLTMTFHYYPSERADKDFYKFSEIMVSKYIDVPCDAIKLIDKDHLNLGMRYAWLSSDLLYKAGERFDAFSINGYGMDPPATAEMTERSGKPVIIGEFHHGATDRGLPATGITGVLTQEDRGKAYRHYIEHGFARPEIIGMHYFQWVDLPFQGRFDGENYNIGVVDVNNRPYPELTKAMTITNERIYEVASGLEEPVRLEIQSIEPIY